MLIHEFASPLEADDRRYRVRVYARERTDNIWVAWLEFDDELEPGERWVTEEETSQPNLAATEYWAGGLEPVYLEGALERARSRQRLNAQ